MVVFLVEGCICLGLSLICCLFVICCFCWLGVFCEFILYLFTFIIVLVSSHLYRFTISFWGDG